MLRGNGPGKVVGVLSKAKKGTVPTQKRLVQSAGIELSLGDGPVGPIT